MTVLSRNDCERRCAALIENSDNWQSGSKSAWLGVFANLSIIQTWFLRLKHTVRTLRRSLFAEFSMITRFFWLATQRWPPVSTLWMQQSLNQIFTWWIVPKRSNGVKSYRQIITYFCSSIESLSFMVKKSVYSIRLCRLGLVLTRLSRFWSTILSLTTPRLKMLPILRTGRWATLNLKQ